MSWPLPLDESSSPLDTIRRRHSRIHVIVSPPRCSSTAFARVLWEQPSVRYYSHEPFEVTYYDEAGLDDVLDKLADPLDLEPLTVGAKSPLDDGLVIKEMPYQIGARFPLLASLATPPLIFLIRDPRQNIASRIEKKIVGGGDPDYPFVESGWELLSSQIEFCRTHNVSCVVVDSRDFRNAPESVFEQLFSRLDLPFSESMLSWRACPDVDLDNLGGEHSHLYLRVLASNGLESATERTPPLESFSEEGGWRDHVAHCLEIYRELSASSERIRPAV